MYVKIATGQANKIAINYIRGFVLYRRFWNIKKNESYMMLSFDKYMKLVKFAGFYSSLVPLCRALLVFYCCCCFSIHCFEPSARVLYIRR
jgi:hypothetical protein